MKFIGYTFIGLGLILVLLTTGVHAQTLTSPDKNITVTVNIGKQITYDIKFKGKEISTGNVLSMTLANGTVLGVNSTLSKKEQHSVNKKVTPLYGMASVYEDNYNELILQFKNKFAVIFRVYNSGVAYRFATSLPGTIRVKDEHAEFHFTNATKAWFQSGKGHNEFYEMHHVYDDISKLNSGVLACLPFMVDGNVKAAILETDLLDYPGMYLEHNGSNNDVKASFPPVVLKDSIRGAKGFKRLPYAYADYIAETNGTRSFPWRIIILAEQDKDLLYNNLTYLLASECKITDVSWIKPGKVAWDWYNANNLSGVNFKTGYNTDTYKYFIDFAAANGIEYILLDEGWSDTQDLLKVNDGSVKKLDGVTEANLNMPVIFEYAKQKGVGVFLWCVWHTLDRQMIPAFDQFEKWGVKGVKVDFMCRDDQYVVNYYERLVKEAAKRKMLVDLHSAYKPAGLERIYPNLVNYEAVQGLEWNKFSDLATPENAAHIPFIRMLAGPMDYTPGGMRNAVQKDFHMSMQRPMTQGTRCQQLAMYTMFYAPLEMLADAPTSYEKERIILKYIAAMPTVWDETIPLDGKIGDYAVIARRKGTTWHVSGITDFTSRTVKIKFDFLSPGVTYEATIFEDGLNADRIGEDYKHSMRKISRNDELEFLMMPGGGFAMKLEKK